MLSLRKCSVLRVSVLGLGMGCFSVFLSIAGVAKVASADDKLPPVPVKDSEAASEAEMKAYTEIIEQTDATIEMLPIPGGKFLMGSPESEANRKADEGPQHEVQISPFWMSKTEITWNSYDVWASDLDIYRAAF